MTDYIMKAEQVLGDDHSFVRLVDSMPVPVLCGQCLDRAAQVHGVVERSATGVRVDAYRCKDHTGGLLVGAEPRTAPGDQRIVDAARTSIAGLNVRAVSDDAKLIRYLVKHKHTTPLEFVRFTFHVRMPIFVARQWVRHRMASINEESGRYGQLRDDFYIPSLERLKAGGQAKSNKQGSGEPLDHDVALSMQTTLRDHSETAYAEYEHLLKHGLARELARLVLPLNIYTQWYWTTDLWNLMNFFNKRLPADAQWEFRQYAVQMIGMAKALAPVAMDAWADQNGFTL